MTTRWNPSEDGVMATPRDQEPAREEPDAAETATESSEPGESGPPGTAAAAPTAAGEPWLERLARYVRRVRLYSSVGFFIALLVVLVVLASENTEAAKLNWVFGSTHASLAWIIVAAAVFGWLLGITTAIVIRRRTRRVQ